MSDNFLVKKIIQEIHKLYYQVQIFIDFLLKIGQLLK